MHSISLAIAVVVMVVGCNYLVDIPLALSVKELFRRSASLSKYGTSVPDLLFYLVCVVTLVSFACFAARARREIFDRATRFFLLLTCAVPLTYALKSVMKLVCGRVNTRIWLEKPELYGFHWFHGSSFRAGFPSGHMAVFAALFAALWRFYPRYRPLYLGSSLLLATALVLTNYHFLGDVIGGAYLGIVVEAGTYHLLSRTSSRF